MKQKSFHYELSLFDEKEPRVLTYQQGEKLAMVLMSQNAPKFILIDDDVINSASIKELNKIGDRKIRGGYLPTTGATQIDEGPEEVEFTSEEENIHNKFLEMKEKLQNKLLLN
jgi:hypothetical protein